MENEVMFIKLDDIIPNRFQPREVFEEEALNKLADSIRRHGVIEPILVRPVSNKYEIIAGERRYKASVLAGLTKIPAIVKQMDDKESSIVAYIENEHRSDVSAIEEARTIDRILKNNNMTQEELAGELGIGQSTIANKLRLLALPMEIQDSLMHNEISERHARSLLSVKDVAKQIELLNKIKQSKMTVRELESEIKNMYNNEKLNEYANISTPVFNENIKENEYVENLNNYDNPINDKPVGENKEFNDYLNNYDNVNPVNNTPAVEDTDFNDYLNNYDNANPTNNTPTEENKGFNDYLNNYDNPINDNPGEEDASFMDYLNNYDNANSLSDTPAVEDASFMDYLNNYDNNIPPIVENESLGNENNNNYEIPQDNNVVINNVTPPITSNFDNNSYIEDNPNYVDVSKAVVISSVNEIIDKLKTVVDDIKENSKFKIDTDEINYDDIYQITIKIDKKDF